MSSLPTTPKQHMDVPSAERWPLADSDIAVLKGLFHASSSQYLAVAFPTPARSLVPQASARKVLLVNDCPVQQLQVCTMLARWGILPQFAHDGVEAVLLAGEQDFDLILIGVDSPGMDGLATTIRIRTAERLRKRFRRIPIVALGTGRVAVDEALWRSSGVDAVLDTPIKEAAIAQCLEDWCPMQAHGMRQ